MIDVMSPKASAVTVAAHETSCEGTAPPTSCCPPILSSHFSSNLSPFEPVCVLWAKAEICDAIFKALSDMRVDEEGAEAVDRSSQHVAATHRPAFILRLTTAVDAKDGSRIGVWAAGGSSRCNDADCD